jgi:biofilm protein TabA
MAHVDGNGSCLLYIYDSDFDTPCIKDQWYESIEDAFNVSNEEFGVDRNSWLVVGVTPEHCQDDWITPARIPGRETGSPAWGRLQLLLDAKWTEVDMKATSNIPINYDNFDRLKVDS